MISVDQNKCLRCNLCVKDCIVEVLTPDSAGFPHLSPELERYCLNCQHCLAICPAGALSCHGVSPEKCALPGKLPEAEKMFNLLRMRRSCRQYKDENLSPEIMRTLKDSLAWTPTGCNQHKLFFKIIEDKNEMAFFRKKTSAMLKLLIKSGILSLFYPRFKRYLKEILGGKDVVYRNAPHMIIAATPKNAPCKEADPWIALSYFDLYAQSLGVGSCWCGFAVHAFKWNRQLKKRLQLPPGYKIGAILLFGPPAVTYARATKPVNFNLEEEK